MLCCTGFPDDNNRSNDYIHIKLQLLKPYFASLSDFLVNYSEDEEEDVNYNREEGEELRFCSDLSSLPFTLESWNLKLHKEEEADDDDDQRTGTSISGSSSNGGALPQKYSLRRRDLVVQNMEELRKAPPGIHGLSIIGCDKLESLPSRIMRSLDRLFLRDCASLKSFPLHPNVLNTLDIRRCKQLQLPTTPGVFPLLKWLCINHSCDSLVSFALDHYPRLQVLFLDGCTSLESLSLVGQEELKSLISLDVIDCLNFVSFPREGLRAPKLSKLGLFNCAVKSLPANMHQLKSLTALIIDDCNELQSIPHGGLPTSLDTLHISFSKKLTPRREWGLDTLLALSYLEIQGCDDLASFPDEGLLPTNLKTLRLVKLPNLKCLDQNGLLQLNSLEELQVYACKKLFSFPERLPRSLSSFTCRQRPLLIRHRLMIARRPTTLRMDMDEVEE